MFNIIEDFTAQGETLINIGADPNAVFVFSSSDQLILPDANITLVNNQLKMVPTNIGAVTVTINGTLTQGETETNLERSFVVTFVRSDVDPSNVAITAPEDKATLTFSYPAELRTLIYDAFWRHYQGNQPGTDEQKSALVKERLLDHVVQIVTNYVNTEAGKQTAQLVSQIKGNALPHVELTNT